MHNYKEVNNNFMIDDLGKEKYKGGLVAMLLEVFARKATGAAFCWRGPMENSLS